MFFLLDHMFGPRLLLLCTQGLFECLALNLYCLGGEQRALTAVINHRIVSIRHFTPQHHTPLLSPNQQLCVSPYLRFTEADVCRSQSKSG